MEDKTMVAFIALFLPAILMACIWLHDEAIGGKPSWKDVSKGVIVYAFCVLLINFLDLLILKFSHALDIDFLSSLNSYGGFAMKYILLSVVIAIALPVGIRAIQKGIVTIRLELPAMPRSRVVGDIALVAYAFVLFSMNFIRIFDHNYWEDEAYSINLIHNPVPTIVSTTANNVHPPLYYLILRAAYLLLGDHGYAYHVVSIVPFAIILVFCLVKVRKVFGTGVALFLMTMASLSSNAVTYNVEIRMYSWAAMFVLLCYYELYQVFLTNQKQHYFWFAFFAIGAAYSHYYALVAVACFYVVLLIWSFAKGKKQIRSALITSACTIVAYLPWLGILLRTFARSSSNFWISTIPTFRECVEYLFSKQFQPVVLVLLAIALVWVALCGTRILHIGAWEDDGGEAVVSLDFSRFHASAQFVWGLAGVVSVVGTMAIGISVSVIFRPLLLLRYIYPVSVVAWLLVGVAISKIRIGKTKLGNLCMAVMLAYMLVTFLPAYRDKYIQEKASNDTLNDTLDAVGDGITDGSTMISDIRQVCGTVAEYYYPGRQYIVIGGSIVGTLEPNNDYWLFLSRGIDDQYAQNLLQEGYSYEVIKNDGDLGTYKVFVYHLMPIQKG